MKALVVVLVALLPIVVGSRALADGHNPDPPPDTGIVGVAHVMVGHGIGCLGDMGWRDEDVSGVPRASSPEVQLAIGRCLGMLDLAIMHSGSILPEEVYEQQLGLYLVTLRPTLMGYADCLAKQCPELEARIRAVGETKEPVGDFLYGVIVEHNNQHNNGCSPFYCAQPQLPS